MARVFSIVEGHNYDGGVDFVNGVAVVPDADTDVLAEFEAKGYTIVEGDDTALTEIEKLPAAAVSELATLLKVDSNANKAGMLNLFSAQLAAVEATAVYAVTGITVAERVDAVAVGQPAQVNDNKFTVAIVSTNAPIYNVTFTVTDTLTTDTGGAPTSGKWIGVCLTLTGIADITTIGYSADGINFSALESDSAIAADKIANSVMYYLNADVGSSTRYLKDAAGVIYTLNFAVAE